MFGILRTTLHYCCGRLELLRLQKLMFLEWKDLQPQSNLTYMNSHVCNDLQQSATVLTVCNCLQLSWQSVTVLAVCYCLGSLLLSWQSSTVWICHGLCHTFYLFSSPPALPWGIPWRGPRSSWSRSGGSQGTGTVLAREDPSLGELGRKEVAR